MKIKVLGTGCPKCKKLYEEAKKAIGQSGRAAEIEKVEKLEEIMSYGVMITPALVIDDEVVSVGKVAKSEEIANWIAAKGAGE
jgi:small redox-active disulfide protein 2